MLISKAISCAGPALDCASRTRLKWDLKLNLKWDLKSNLKSNLSVLTAEWLEHYQRRPFDRLQVDRGDK